MGWPIEFAYYHRLPRVACDGCDFACRVGGAGSICGMHQDLATLAHNLAIGGALCRAHNIGEGSGYEWATRQPIWPRWEPGCNREARLAEEERKQPGAFADIYGDRSKWRAP